MTLIICSECGKEYSDKAQSCPNCACPTSENIKSIEEKKKIDDDLSFEFDAKSGEILKYKGHSKKIKIPATIDGHSVKKIGQGVFKGMGLEEIILPKGLIEIGDEAFAINYIHSIDIPDTVTVIGSFAFSFNKLEYLDLPKSVKKIGLNAFSNNPFFFVYTHSIDQLGFDWAWIISTKGTDSLNGVKKIYDNGLIIDYKDGSHVQIHLCENYEKNSTIIKTTIDGNNKKHENCKLIYLHIYGATEKFHYILVPGTDTIYEDENFYFSNNKILRYKGTSKNVIIPDKLFNQDVKVIGYNAFYPDSNDEDCKFPKIESVILPNGLEEIEPWAFHGNNIEKIDLPNSLNIIGEYAFYDNKIKSICIPNKIEEIEEGAFCDNSLNEVILSNSIKKIRKHAFEDNKIKNIEIPESVKVIYEGAFENNEIENIEIPESVDVIDIYAFKDNKIESIALLGNKIEIGVGAFDIDKIKTIYITNDEMLDFLIYRIGLKYKISYKPIHEIIKFNTGQKIKIEYI